jgi:hypothetical protein
MEKIGDVCMRNVHGRFAAYWCPVDGSRAFLCAIEQRAFDNHPHVRDLFMELSQEVLLNRAREKGDGRCLRVREPLARTVRIPFECEGGRRR